MALDVVSSLDALSPSWLDATLRASGALDQARVTGLAIEPTEAFNSVSAHLSVTYDAPDQTETSDRLFLKLMGGENGERELACYRFLSAHAPDLEVVPRCLLARHDPATGRTMILLEDHSQSHVPPVSRERVLALDGVPGQACLDAVIDTLAAFHARFWEHPALGEGIAARSGSFQSRENYLAQVENVRGWWRDLRGSGEGLPPEIVALYDHAAERLPRLWERHYAARFASLRNLTLINGDCYFSQFLCPRDPAAEGKAGRAYIVDFEVASTNLAADDLVFLMATFWTRLQRAEGHRERRALERYLAGLRAGGVTEDLYGAEDLMLDYRLQLIWRIFHPVWDTSYGCGRGYWWPKMSCLTAAYQDWNCGALLAD